MKLLNLLVILLCFVNLSCAQKATTTQSQTVVINTSLFYDERVGIIPLILAVKPLYSEFQTKDVELKEMITQHQKLADEISKFQSSAKSTKGVSNEILNKKKDEFEILEAKIKSKTEEANSLFEKRKKELTKDLRKDIALSIEQFAKEKSYIVVLNDSQELPFENSVDATQEFIKFYNSSPKRK